MTLRRAKTSTFWDVPNVATGQAPVRTTLSISASSIRPFFLMKFASGAQSSSCDGILPN
jgi:hypothetical protein